MSDIMFLEYANTALLQKHDPKDLRYIFPPTITTEYSNKVIEYILKQHGMPEHEWEYVDERGHYQAPEWEKKVTIGLKDEEEFKALLHTAQCSFVAYLLLQHQEQLGLKRISKMHIFRDVTPKQKHEGVGRQDYRGASILVELENVDSSGNAVPWGKAVAAEGLAGASGTQRQHEKDPGSGSGKKPAAPGSGSKGSAPGSGNKGKGPAVG